MTFYISLGIFWCVWVFIVIRFMAGAKKISNRSLAPDQAVASILEAECPD